MKKHLIMLVLMAMSVMLMANSGTIRLQNGTATSEILQSSPDGLKVRFAIDQLEFFEVQSSQGVWTAISAQDFTSTNKVGEPKLPLLRKIISVPLGAELQFSLSKTQRSTVSLAEKGINYPILPAQESVSKSANPEELTFVVNRDFYNGEYASNESLIQISELGMMRGERLFALDFVPINYNPASKSLDVVLSTEIELSFVGADHAATAELKAKTYSPAFEGAFASTVWNHQATRSTVLRYPMGYLIILPANFNAAMQPFIDWKTREGFNVTVATIESIGNTTNQIKTYIQGLWNDATVQNPAPSYLLIVGDVAQVRSNTSTTFGSHPTDLHYVRLQGTDYMPEMFFGRFSATSVAQVTNQVNKTLMHEQYTMPNDDYLAKTVLIAGHDASWAPTHGNGQIAYATQNYFNIAHGITSNNYLYPTSQNSAAPIIANASEGRGYINYTAHGDVGEWYSPKFTIANVNSLQNLNEYSFVVGNCCLTSKFDDATCFAEAWLRAENKGGVVYIGGTNSTYWDEDYWWGVGAKGSATGSAPAYNANALGIYDALFHEHNEGLGDWAGSAGALIMMGNLAVAQGNSTRTNYYWEIYSIMGDPSLVPYLGIPANNAMNIPETIFLGLGSVEIVADPYTYVAISMDGELHGVGLTDASGYLMLDYIPFETPGLAEIVATRSMRKPLIGYVSVIPNDGAYITVGHINLVDDNGIAEAGETIAMDLTFTNVGVMIAENLSVSIETESPWVYFTTSETNIDDISPSGVLTVSSIFSAQIDQGTPDQHVAEFLITVTDGVSVWSTTRSLTINAPDVIINSVNFYDPNNNGIFEAGETINVTLNITNAGHMMVESGTLDLILNSPLASLPLSSFTIPGINTGMNIPLSFDIILASNIEDGVVIPLGVALDMGVQMINHSVLIPIGAVMEGFETGDFSTFPWENTSNQPWTIVNSMSHSGSYSARSGVIGHNSSTSLQVTVNVGLEGEVSFWRQVSSEARYDHLKFYIDGAEMGSWNGIQTWAEFSYPVSAGAHTFKWTYIKDVSTTGGTDTAWIDDIRFPLSGNSTVPMAYSNTASISFPEVLPNTTVSESFVLRNLGTGNLEGTITVPAEFSLSHMGQALPNDHYYEIGAGVTKIYTISFVAGENVPDIDSEIQIMTNDPDLPVITIPIHLIGVANSDLINPAVTALKGNFPNPFNPSTSIRFSLKDASPVLINIYNLKGQLVKSLLKSELSSGNHQITWNGKDDRGAPVASGIYLYRMESNNFKATNKMMLMK
ncbi:MAG: C25 family cysteine peptidase [Candidatus Cloacimonetes bacterium]|nr:C25 family cysteine peptidase [Candidatus Cloacimonadota bacterium]MDY0228554.1 C25 family cysteine peptidase [Candidatus Cloacimonadaceae bacterium]